MDLSRQPSMTFRKSLRSLRLWSATRALLPAHFGKINATSSVRGGAGSAEDGCGLELARTEIDWAFVECACRCIALRSIEAW